MLFLIHKAVARLFLVFSFPPTFLFSNASLNSQLPSLTEERTARHGPRDLLRKPPFVSFIALSADRHLLLCALSRPDTALGIGGAG